MVACIHLLEVKVTHLSVTAHNTPSSAPQIHPQNFPELLRRVLPNLHAALVTLSVKQHPILVERRRCAGTLVILKPPDPDPTMANISKFRRSLMMLILRQQSLGRQLTSKWCCAEAMRGIC